MSSNETTKNAPTQQPYPPTYPPFNGAYPPPGPYPPPYYTYVPPPDGAQAENGGHPGHHPYMMYPPPPGMVYAYPPPGQGFYQGEANGKQTKRKQVKMACTNCAAACKRCDEARPCERCIKYGLADQCQDGVRKERKKGIKRGPYKRKNKSGGSSDGTTFASFPQQTGNGDSAAGPEWQSSPQPGTVATSSTATTSAGIHAVAQFGPGPPPPGPEGYYPYYYPPPHGFMPPPPPQGQDAPPDGSQVQPGPNAIVQYFSVHPGGYPPFPHYPPYPPQQPGGAPPQPQAQQQTMDPKKANAVHRQESEEAEEEEEEESSPVPPKLVPVAPPGSAPISASVSTPSKKRARVVKGGEPKANKVTSKMPKKASKAKAAAKAANKGHQGYQSVDSDPVVSTA